jgi:hypothetical protein
MERAGWSHQRPNIERFLLIAGVGIHKFLAHEVGDIGIGLAAEVGYWGAGLRHGKDKVEAGIGNHDLLKDSFTLLGAD